MKIFAIKTVKKSNFSMFSQVIKISEKYFQANLLTIGMAVETFWISRRNDKNFVKISRKDWV